MNKQQNVLVVGLAVFAGAGAMLGLTSNADSAAKTDWAEVNGLSIIKQTEYGSWQTLTSTKHEGFLARRDIPEAVNLLDDNLDIHLKMASKLLDNGIAVVIQYPNGYIQYMQPIPDCNCDD